MSKTHIQPAQVAVITAPGQTDSEALRLCIRVLEEFRVQPAVETAATTAAALRAQCKTLCSDGIRVLIVAAGSLPSLPARVARLTSLPILAVPVPASLPASPQTLAKAFSKSPQAPVATLAIGEAGARNAALAAIAILALTNPGLSRRLDRFRRNQTASVLKVRLQQPKE